MLHRYYLWAYRMQAHHAAIGKRPLEPGFQMQRWKVASFQYGGLWLSQLYVVVEVWRMLKFSDQTIVQLLQSGYVESLRRLRNALFHFQPDYSDARVALFFGDDSEPVKWATEVHGAFDKWFRNKMEIAGGR